MKKILLIILIFTGTRAVAQFESASLQAAGLTCAMCTKAINKALEKLPFINTVDANIETSSFEITFKEGNTVEIDKIRDAVTDAGFSIAKLKLTGNFTGIAVKNDAHIKIGDNYFHFLGVGNKTLSGKATIQLAEKDFLGAKEFKKYSNLSKMTCIKTGRAGTCCTGEGIAADTRIYHVTI